MNKRLIITALITTILISGCTTAFKAQPLPFRLPSQYPNATEVAGVMVGAEAYVDSAKATPLFGFNIREAGMLPVQVVFDNRATTPLTINPGQTFLIDKDGNLWPILKENFAYDRVTKYTQTKKIFGEGAYSGFLGGVAGALIGAAVGVVTGEDVGKSVGRGAVVGAATGAVVGGASGAITADDAAREVMDDFKDKSLQNKPIPPGNIAYGFIFFPGEAQSAALLRLQLIEKDSGKIHNVELRL